MALLGLETNVGMTAAILVGVLAVLWNYSSLSDVRWNEITAGVMAFVSGAGVQWLNASPGLGTFANVPLGQLTALLYLVGGLLVFVGGLVNAAQVLQRQYA